MPVCRMYYCIARRLRLAPINLAPEGLLIKYLHYICNQKSAFIFFFSPWKSLSNCHRFKALGLFFVQMCVPYPGIPKGAGFGYKLWVSES